MSPTAITVLDSPGEAQAWCAARRDDRARLGFVPTMGALHEGHLSLVRRAAAENDQVCVSVFVNPLQFDDPADLERYPRDFAGDARLLEAEGCAMAFTGTLEGFFPEETGAPPPVDPGPGALGLEGAHRPGHFEGVATIVRRLFDVTRPNVAYFGEKDFQQTLVVRHVAAELGQPEIQVCATSREADGLARSSRNLLLDPAARERATVLSRALAAARDTWVAGERDAEALRAALDRVLEEESGSIEVEYAEVRDPAEWTAGRPLGTMHRARALIAARVGGVRLIDNIDLENDCEIPGGPA